MPTFTANKIQARECLAQMHLLRVQIGLTIEKTRETICESREIMTRANNFTGELLTGPAMIDAKECRANAARCFEIANRPDGNVPMQNTLFDVAKIWMRLAVQMERRATARRITSDERAAIQA
jgi:hypothetical protein